MLDVPSILACTFGPLWLVFCACTNWAFWFRRHSPCIKYRSPTATLLAALMIFLVGALYILRWSRQYQIPCFISLWITQFSFPVIYCVVICRSVRLLFLYRISEAKLVAALHTREDHAIRLFDTSKSKKMKQVHFPEPSPTDNMIYPSDRIFMDVQDPNVPVEKNWFQRYQKLAAVHFLKMTVGCILALHIIVLVIIQCFTTRASIYPNMGFTECFSGWEWIPHQVFSVIYNIIILILFIAYRDVTDGFRVRSELIAMGIINSLMDVFFFFYYDESWANRLDPNSYLINVAFLYLFTFQYQMIIKPTMIAQIYQPTSIVNTRSSKKPHLTLCMESFDFILQSSYLMEQFKLFATKDFSVENVLFYQRCLKFRQIAEEGTGSCILAEAFDIYDVFIAYESHLMINLNGRTRQDIEDLLYQNSYHVNMFDEAAEEIKDLLFRNTFPRFLQGKRHTQFDWDSPTQV
ncbi:hypothetical protein K7432_004746 [Basidiobolus ranarum]|uniref:RGS domain-containing protein n=1 Tax=Basidiobolus ranarum TaxID=34480 RepID=A0ABR2WXV2_9FUNG